MKTIPIAVAKDAQNSLEVVSDSPRTLLLFVLPYFIDEIGALGVKTKSYLAFPYGPLTISTYVSRNTPNGSRVVIEDLNFFSSNNFMAEASAAIKRLKPDIVGYSFMFDNSYEHLAGLSALTRELLPDVPQIVGGAAATTSYEQLLRLIPSLDAVCYSEGEVAINNLLATKNLVAGLRRDPWFYRGRTDKPKSLYVDNLDVVVDLDYSLVASEKYSMKEAFSPFATYRDSDNVKQFFLVTSRGCPFKCTFCAEPSLHGDNMRYASVDSIISHVEKLKREYDVNVLTIYDDQLLLNFRRAKELFRRLAQFDLRIEMPNGVTAVFIDDEMAELMSLAGVDTVPLAIESGSDFVLRNIINKPLRLGKLPGVVRSLKKYGIFVQGFFVIGMPGETDYHREETSNLIREIKLDWASFSIASPVRGSMLYEEAKEKGWLPDDYQVGQFVNNFSPMTVPGLDNEKIKVTQVELNLIHNFIENRAIQDSDFETAIRCFKEVSERVRNHAYADHFLSVLYESKGDAISAAHFRSKRDLSISKFPEWLDYCDGFLSREIAITHSVA